MPSSVGTVPESWFTERILKRKERKEKKKKNGVIRERKRK